MVFGEASNISSTSFRMSKNPKVSIVKTTFANPGPGNDDIPDDEVGFKRLVLCSDRLLDHLVQLQ
jgi:hypothetical protein